MSQQNPNPGDQVVIAKAALQTVFDSLKNSGYTLIGPTLREEAILYAEITSLTDLPVGWADEQTPGAYRLRRGADNQYFGYVVGPTSWKRYLYPANLTLFSVRKESDGVEFFSNPTPPPRYAFIGARACDLAAIAVQDRILMGGAVQDPHYRARREQAFILAVNCTEPAQSCFCTSMQTGPRCAADFDLALTELQDLFLVEIGSPLGGRMMADTEHRLAGALEVNQARQRMTEAEGQITRRLETSDLPDLLMQNLDHPHWDEVAQRCLSCANCTMVCPTCFCTDVQDVSDLTGAHSDRIRVWDSCFNPDFSSVHGGNLRPTVSSRYRQWLTHKLASWVGQFGVSGCVGCGRCITWCPAAIDLTAEVAAIRGEEVR